MLGSGFASGAALTTNNLIPSQGAEVNNVLEWDITALVQDAIDNEGGILKLAVYGDDDNDVSTGTIYENVQQGNVLLYDVKVYDNANNMLEFYSAEHGSAGDPKRPQVCIKFIDRTP